LTERTRFTRVIVFKWARNLNRSLYRYYIIYHSLALLLRASVVLIAHSRHAFNATVRRSLASLKHRIGKCRTKLDKWSKKWTSRC